MAPAYIPGLQLAREFCAAVVRPLLEERFPRVPYAAALLGPGSEVAGLDSQRSTDHDWGPRLQVFLTGGDAGQAGAVTTMLPAGCRSPSAAIPSRSPSPGNPAAAPGTAWRSPAWAPG